MNPDFTPDHLGDASARPKYTEVNLTRALTDEKPIIRQRTGKGDKTHWIIFVKAEASND